MTDEERKALVERLRDVTFRADFPAGHVITGDNLALTDVDQAADQIDADGQRIAELEAALRPFAEAWDQRELSEVHWCAFKNARAALGDKQ